LQNSLDRWTKALTTGSKFEVEYRLKRAVDGVYRWHLGRASPMRDRHGAISQWVGTCTDIDDQKRAEVRLRGAYATLEQRVRERTAELAATLKEREIMLLEIHHRVKNNLQVITSLINMQVREVKDDFSRKALQECQARIQTIALIHEKLYQSKDYSRVPFSEYAKTLATNIFHAAGISPTSIALNLEIEPLSLAVDKAIPCGLLLNELITNALKHAFPNARRGTVRVELRKAGDLEIVLAVGDDGIGLSAHFDPAQSNSLGVQLVTTLVEQLDGRLEITRAGGTTFSVIFPVEAQP
jgi:two-component sensor histidine kinase